MRARGAILRGAAFACAVGAGASCYDSSVPFASAEGMDRTVFKADGEVVHEVTVRLSMFGGRGTAHYALDEVTLDSGSAPLVLDPVEIVPGEWPVVVEGTDAVVTRTLRLSARHRPAAPATPLFEARIGVVNDESTELVQVFLGQEVVQEDCPPPDVAALVAPLGATVTWQNQTLNGYFTAVESFAANDSGDIWIIGASDIAGVNRMIYANASDLGGAKEVAAGGQLVAGGDRSVMLVAERSSDVDLTRYDKGLGRLWTRRASGIEAFSVRAAVAGGRVLFAFRDLGGAQLEGDEPFPPGAENRLVTLDEATGEVEKIVDFEWVIQAKGLPDGAFAIRSGNGDIVVLEPDLTERWRAPGGDVQELAVTSDGRVWARTSAEVLIFASSGNLDATISLAAVPIPPGARFAPGEGGSVLLTSSEGLTRVAPDGTSTPTAFPSSAAPWCEVRGDVLVTGTGSSVAYVMLPDPSGGATMWRWPTTMGVLVP